MDENESPVERDVFVQLETHDFLPVVWDPKTDRFLVEDRDFQDWVTTGIYKRRRVWMHTCRKPSSWAGAFTVYTQVVTECPKCGAPRPPLVKEN